MFFSSQLQVGHIYIFSNKNMEVDITRGFPPPIQKTNRPRISSWFLWQGSSSLVVQLSQLVICKFLVKHLEEMNPEQGSPVVTIGP